MITSFINWKEHSTEDQDSDQHKATPAVQIITCCAKFAHSSCQRNYMSGNAHGQTSLLGLSLLEHSFYRVSSYCHTPGITKEKLLSLILLNSSPNCYYHDIIILCSCNTFLNSKTLQKINTNSARGKMTCPQHVLGQTQKWTPPKTDKNQEGRVQFFKEVRTTDLLFYNSIEINASFANNKKF